MILHGYCYFNRKVGAYTAPTFEAYDKDYKKEVCHRGYLLAKDEQKITIEENDLYFVGTFNDKSGEFNLLDKPEFLLTFAGEHNDVRKETNNLSVSN